MIPLKDIPLKLKEIKGDDNQVTGVQIENIKNKETQEISASGVFIAIGHKPNTEIFIDQLDMKDGYIKITSGTEGSSTETSKPGIFAAGDVSDHIYRQAVTSAGSGCMAALDAEKYLSEK